MTTRKSNEPTAEQLPADQPVAGQLPAEAPDENPKPVDDPEVNNELPDDPSQDEANRNRERGKSEDAPGHNKAEHKDPNSYPDPENPPHTP